MTWTIDDLLGSSPLTRGARLIARVLIHAGRLIPAYAGSTSGKALRANTDEAHPRLRGEHRATVHSAPRL